MKTDKPILKILLIDDDSDIVELLHYNLVKAGYEVLGLTNPLDVPDAIKTFSPQMVVMDIMMPNLNGFQLCTLLRSMEGEKDLTIFFITAGESKLNQAAMQCGADDFIQKFSGLRTLIHRIDLVMKKHLIIKKRIGTLHMGRWEINRETHTAHDQTKEIRLTELEFDLLYFLAQNARRSIPIKFLNFIIEGAEAFHKNNSIIHSLQVLTLKIGEGLIVFTSEHRVRLNA